MTRRSMKPVSLLTARRVVDGPGMPIRAFLAEMTAMVREKRPRNVVIVMRLNGGGDLNNARDWCSSVPTLRPDLPAPLTFDAWSAGRDPAMEAVTKSLGTGH